MRLPIALVQSVERELWNLDSRCAAESISIRCAVYKNEAGESSK
jgi:hypothetical protein